MYTSYTHTLSLSHNFIYVYVIQTHTHLCSRHRSIVDEAQTLVPYQSNLGDARVELREGLVHMVVSNSG